MTPVGHATVRGHDALLFDFAGGNLHVQVVQNVNVLLRGKMAHYSLPDRFLSISGNPD